MKTDLPQLPWKRINFFDRYDENELCSREIFVPANKTQFSIIRKTRKKNQKERKKKALNKHL